MTQTVTDDEVHTGPESDVLREAVAALEAAEPLRVAIEAMDLVAGIIAAKIPSADYEGPVTLTFTEWHASLKRLQTGRFGLRTKQHVDRRSRPREREADHG